MLKTNYLIVSKSKVMLLSYKFLFTFILLLFQNGFLKAQGNLAPDPDFSNYNTCPLLPNWASFQGTNLIEPDINGIYTNILPEWRDVGEARFGGSSTGSWYFNSCNTEPCGTAIGTNNFGFQNDRKNDPNSGYMCIKGFTGYPVPIIPKPPLGSGLDTIVPQGPNKNSRDRSYITTQLLTPLQAGKTYEIFFYISLAERSTLAVNNMGVVFTNSRFPIGNNRSSPIIDLGDLAYNSIPFDYFTSDVIIIDRVNWVKVSGTVTATDNYSWITIGVFDNYFANNFQVAAYQRLPPDPTCVPQPAAGYNGYPGFAYYLDDVGIYEQPNPAFNYNLLGAICDNVDFNAIAASNQPWYIHNWKLLKDNILINQTNTGNSPTVNFNNYPAGTYTLIHEVTGYGATYTSQQTITITGYNHATYTANTGFETWTAGNNPLNGNSGRTATIKDVLLIPSNSHIIVEDMEILFGPNAKLVIEPGASFTANNSTFNVNEECEAIMWNGIEVWGNSNRPQGAKPTDPYQGYLELKNCTLTNAYNGVYVGKIGSSCSGGGVAKITGCEFTNNKVHLKMINYPGVVNKSIVLRTNFTSTDFLRDGSGIAVTNYVELEGIRRIRLSQCNFNTAFNDARLTIGLRGNGIYSINSAVYLNFNNTFTDLNTAVRLIRTGRTASTCTFQQTIPSITAPSNYISNNTITNCYRGIWASNTMGDYIVNNSVNVLGKVIFEDPESVGIYSEGCSPILITNNTLTRNLPDSYGIFVRNNGTFGSIVEGNTFDNMGFGLQHDYNNKLATINCNTFNNPSGQDWVISPDRAPWKPYVSGVFFPASIGDCQQGRLSGNQFLNGCIAGSTKQIRSYAVFDYSVPFIASSTDPEQNCVSSTVTIDFCDQGNSTSICSEVTNDPNQLDNLLRSSTNEDERQYLLAKLVSARMADTLETNIFSLLALHNPTPTQADRKLLVQANLFANNLIGVQQQITAINTVNIEDEVFVNFYLNLLSKMNTGYTMDSLGNIAFLESIAQENYTVSDLAISILEAYYNANYAHNPVKLQNNQGRIALSSNIDKASLPYPNPADKQLTLKYELIEGDKVLVYSNLGSVIKTITINTNALEYNVNTESFQSGIYYLVIMKQNGESVKFNFSIVH